MANTTHADSKPRFRAEGLRFAIVVSRFNSFITERLLAGALDSLHAAGAGDDQIEVVRVPGSFELPIAAKKLAQTGKYDSLIAIGCILRGETSHYDHVCSEAARGLQLAQMDTGVPIAFCLLTCDTLEQAIDRAGLKAGNKGFDAGLTAVEMANLSCQLRGGVAAEFTLKAHPEGKGPGHTRSIRPASLSPRRGGKRK
jgi:6,7-dimethyl-8-ribityllumazine synthase